MGMFDYIKCDVDLPDGKPTPEHWFQTKDFGNDMETYTITKEGRIIHHTVRYEDVPKEERPYPDDDGFMGLCGSIRSVPTGDVDINFHGLLNFYGGDGKEWREFDGKFTDGKLVEIKQLED